MFNVVALPTLCRICVYLTNPLAAKFVQCALEAEGLNVVVATSSHQFLRATKARPLTAIVTTSALIAEIRASAMAPILDIEPLIADWAHNYRRMAPKAFDKLNFLRGVTFTATRP
ncbi:hypothetical protein [Roseixanthobacter pseudopolyaromaticivorans]|uniref:hypothetical protein n=1 Tax=Xanthobacteraceae TaxID=335928 RepID=UPI002C87393B|nr:hypothetical protein [Hyphomicrobium sp.]